MCIEQRTYTDLTPAPPASRGCYRRFHQCSSGNWSDTNSPRRFNRDTATNTTINAPWWRIAKAAAALIAGVERTRPFARGLEEQHALHIWLVVQLYTAPRGETWMARQTTGAQVPSSIGNLTSAVQRRSLSNGSARNLQIAAYLQQQRWIYFNIPRHTITAYASLKYRANLSPGRPRRSRSRDLFTPTWNRLVLRRCRSTHRSALRRRSRSSDGVRDMSCHGDACGSSSCRQITFCRGRVQRRRRRALSR